MLLQRLSTTELQLLATYRDEASSDLIQVSGWVGGKVGGWLAVMRLAVCTGGLVFAWPSMLTCTSHPVAQLGAHPVLLLHLCIVQALAAERVEGARRDYHSMELPVGQAAFIPASCSTLFVVTLPFF